MIWHLWTEALRNWRKDVSVAKPFKEPRAGWRTGAPISSADSGTHSGMGPGLPLTGRKGAVSTVR